MGTDLGTPVAKKTLLFSREVSATASRVTPLARGDSITGARSGGILWGGRARRPEGGGGPSGSRPPTPLPDPMARIPKNDGFWPNSGPPKKANF
jgi:hypothetical protein